MDDITDQLPTRSWGEMPSRLGEMPVLIRREAVRSCYAVLSSPTARSCIPYGCYFRLAGSLLSLLSARAARSFWAVLSSRTARSFSPKLSFVRLALLAVLSFDGSLVFVGVVAACPRRFKGPCSKVFPPLFRMTQIFGNEGSRSLVPILVPVPKSEIISKSVHVDLAVSCHCLQRRRKGENLNGVLLPKSSMR